MKNGQALSHMQTLIAAGRYTVKLPNSRAEQRSAAGSKYLRVVYDVESEGKAERGDHRE